MELSSPWLYGDDGGHSYAVTQQLGCQLGGDGLGLEFEMKIKIK